MSRKKPKIPSERREVFILRLWKPHQLDDWAVELQDVHSGQVQHLRYLDDLADSLRAWLAAPREAPKEAPKGEKDH